MSETPIAEQAAPEAAAPEQVPEDQTEAPEADEIEEDWRSNFDADKAAARIRKLQSEAKNLRERAKSAEQKAAGVDERDQKITALEAKNLQLEVGFELGLPKELVNRIQGNTRDELIADAQALVELIGAPKVPAPRRPVEALRGGGQPEREPEETDVRKIGARMFSN